MGEFELKSELKLSDKHIRSFLIERIDKTETTTELEELCNEISKALEKGYKELEKDSDELESEYYKEAAETLRDIRNGIW